MGQNLCRTLLKPRFFNFLSAIGLIALIGGIFSNWLVIALNGGMPNPMIGLVPVGKWTWLDSSTRLAFLADILPGGWSIGDLLMIAGGPFIALGLLYWLTGGFRNWRYRKVEKVSNLGI